MACAKAPAAVTIPARSGSTSRARYAGLRVPSTGAGARHPAADRARPRRAAAQARGGPCASEALEVPALPWPIARGLAAPLCRPSKAWLAPTARAMLSGELGVELLALPPRCKGWGGGSPEGRGGLKNSAPPRGNRVPTHPQKIRG